MSDRHELTFGHRTFIFTVDQFFPPTPATYWDPPDDGECVVAGEVWIRHWSSDEDMDEVVTWKTAVREYAYARGLSFDEADENLHTSIYQLALLAWQKDDARADTDDPASHSSVCACEACEWAREEHGGGA